MKMIRRSKLIVQGCISILLLLILSGLSYLNEISSEREGSQSNSLSNLINKDSIILLSGGITRHSEKYKRADGTAINIIAYTGKDNRKYEMRFVNAVKNSLEFIEKNISRYPYKEVIIIDVVGTTHGKFLSKKSANIITVGAEMFSPLETQQPEYLIVHAFTDQFIHGIKKTKEDESKSFREGLTTYVARKIMQQYYGDPIITFNLFNYYPIYGLNLLSYNEIPLIYSLGKFYYPEGAISFENYVKSPQMYSIADTSAILPNDIILRNASWAKPHLALISMERYLGFNKMMSVISAYVADQKNRTVNQFLSVVQNFSNEDLNWLFDNLFYSSSVFDYKIKYVKRTQKTYEVYTERLGDGIFKQDIVLYTDKDTLNQEWNGRERWKIFKFRTSHKVIGAEIDPYRKNLLDLDYSNNSYFIKHQYGGSLGLSFRWFFWMQNLLLILGSIA